MLICHANHQDILSKLSIQIIGDIVNAIENQRFYFYAYQFKLLQEMPFFTVTKSSPF